MLLGVLLLLDMNYPMWNEYIDDIVNQYYFQIIIPENNYGYGVNNDADLYADDDSDYDSMPELEQAVPGDADWGVPDCNAEVP